MLPSIGQAFLKPARNVFALLYTLQQIGYPVMPVATYQDPHSSCFSTLVLLSMGKMNGAAAAERHEIPCAAVAMVVNVGVKVESV